MSYHYVQAGGTLYRAPAGAATATEVPLLDHLTLEDLPPNFALVQRRVCISNSPSFNIMMVPGDIVRGESDRMVSMSPIAPNRAVSRVEGAPTSGEGLTGSYKVRVSFAVKNLSTGAILAESPLGPASEAVDLTGEALSVKGIPISNEPSVNCRRLYRTATDGGNVYYHWEDLDGPAQATTTFIGEASDASIVLAPAPLDTETGNPPGAFGSDTRLDLLTSWKGRLFGVAAGTQLALNDTLIWSEARRPDRWPALNNQPIAGATEKGITGLIARRLTLGIGTENTFSVIADAGQAPKEIASIGPLSHASCVAHEDMAWFIARDGIYQWDNRNQVTNVSRDRVHPWFYGDEHFNRAAFNKIVGTYHEGRQSVMWLMPSAEETEGVKNTSLDRWIEYYPETGVILGPHKLQEEGQDLNFTFTSFGVYNDAEGLDTIAFTATDGKVYVEDPEHFDGEAVGPAIDAGSRRREALFDAISPAASGNLVILAGVQAPSEGSGQITLAGNRPSSAFAWADIETSRDEALFIGEDIVCVSKNSDGDVQLIFSDPSILPIHIRLETVHLEASTDEIVSLPQGVEMVVEVQTQTMGAPNLDKYHGELSIFMNAEAGHRVHISTDLDDGAVTRDHGYYTDLFGVLHNDIAAPIKTRYRLNRIGTGNKLAMSLNDDSTADVDWFGYQIPLGPVGQRVSNQGS